MIAEFAALAQIAISAYETQQNQNAANTASSMAQGQEQAQTHLENTTATQSFQGAQYDEQWMQLKQMSAQVYGIKQTAPAMTALAAPGPTLK